VSAGDRGESEVYKGEKVDIRPRQGGESPAINYLHSPWCPKVILL
jgi:hypothetical protein